MGKQAIANTTCAFCNKLIKIASEYINWEHISDCGETEENPELKDFSIHQKIRCPHCGKDNQITITMKGTDESNIDPTSIKVINFSEIQNSIGS